MKLITKCNIAVLLVYLLVFLVEVIKSFFYDSIVVSLSNNSNVFLVVILLLAVALVFGIKNKKRLHFYTVICMVTVSMSVILLMSESIYFYLPWNHNEQFIFLECFLIYFAFFTLVWSFLNIVIRRMQGDGSIVSRKN